jgi:deazaflavin-dependent oxidoreductase (nitroreductase family)
MTTAPNDFNRSIIDEFRANDGKTSGPFANAPLLLLTTTGAKSGKKHTTPVVYTRDGDQLVVIASFAGRPQNPAWFHNLVANPTVTVEVPGDTFDARAEVVEGEDRDRLYRTQADLMPGFDEYQQKTTRRIPVVRLTRL